MNKLTLLHIGIIAVVVSLVLAATMWFLMIKPKNEDLEATKISAESTRQAGGTDAKINDKVKELARTKKQAAETEANWNVNVVKYMPAFPYQATTNDLYLYFYPPVGKSSKGPLTGFRDIPTVWGQWVTAWYDAQKNQGVERAAGTEFPIDEFSIDPNLLTAKLENHLTFPSDGKTWPVKLRCKSFDEAMNHLKRFNNMEHHGMPVINNVVISGQSPDLMLDYEMAMYIIPRTPPPARDPMIGGGAAAPAGGMGMGGGMPSSAGMGGGMPGSAGMGAGRPPGSR